MLARDKQTLFRKFSGVGTNLPSRSFSWYRSPNVAGALDGQAAGRPERPAEVNGKERMKDGGLSLLPPLTEGELGEYLDGEMDAGRRAALDGRLDANPDQRAEVERIRLAEAELMVCLDAMLDEPVPDRLLALLEEDVEEDALRGATSLP